MVILLGWELAKYEILDKVMKEFLRRGLDKVYVKEIEEWKKYKREKKFAKKLDKNMEDELKKFEKNIKKWEPKELEKIVWDIIPHTTTN